METDGEDPGATGYWFGLIGFLNITSDVWGIITIISLVLGAILAIAGAFAGASLLRFSKARLLQAIEDENKKERIKILLKDPEELAVVAALMKIVGILGVISGIIYWSSTSTKGLIIWAILGTIISVLVLEILPSCIARRNAEKVVLWSVRVLLPLKKSLSPLIKGISEIKKIFLRAVGLPVEPKDYKEELAQEILAAVEEKESPEPLAKDEKEWIENIVEINEITASAVMTPRTEIVGVEVNTPLTEALQLAVSEGHSRLPVYEDKLDVIVGIFYVKDILPQVLSGQRPLSDISISEIMRKPFFVPETKKIPDLLKEFKARRLHMAIVLDEYGGTAGLITIEDILEEIVGEIEDEYDVEESEPVKIVEEGRVAEVDARCHVREINECLGTSFPENGDFDTIGGFVCSVLGRIPVEGEVFEEDGVRFKILKAGERSIHQLRIEVLEKARNSHSSNGKGGRS